MIKVFIADDHDIFRHGLRSILSTEEDIFVSGEVSSLDSIFTLLAQYNPDILLLDLNFPNSSAKDILLDLRSKFEKLKIIILTVESQPSMVTELIKSGADGYLLKGTSINDMLSSIRAVYSGDNYIDKSLVSYLFKKVSTVRIDSLLDTLTQRELEITYFMSKGYTNEEIGNKIFLSPKSVKNNVSSIFKKLEVDSRVNAVLYAVENDISSLYESKIK